MHMTYRSVAQRSTSWHGMAWRGLAWRGLAWYRQDNPFVGGHDIAQRAFSGAR